MVSGWSGVGLYRPATSAVATTVPSATAAAAAGGKPPRRADRRLPSVRGAGMASHPDGRVRRTVAAPNLGGSPSFRPAIAEAELKLCRWADRESGCDGTFSRRTGPAGGPARPCTRCARTRRNRSAGRAGAINRCRVPPCRPCAAGAQMDVSPAQRCLQGFGGVAAALRPGCKNPTGLRRAIEGRFEIAPEVAEADLAHECATSPLLHSQ